MFFRVANLELHLDYPSAFKERTRAAIKTHSTAPDAVSPGSAVLWVGRFRAVVSYSRQDQPDTP